MDQNLMARQFDALDREDPYSMLKQDFSSIFFKHNLDSFTNPSDIGFLDYGKTYLDQFPSHFDDHANLLEAGNSQALRMPAQRDDHLNYPDALVGPTYSPIGRSHHAGGHFEHPNMHQNRAYNMRQQQPYQQEHPRYNNYHPQNYHYQNQYDPHMMQSSYDNGLDYYYQGQDLMDNHNDDPLSLMWSDKSAKVMKMENTNNGYNGDLGTKTKGPSGYEQSREAEKYNGAYGHDMRGGQVVKMQDMTRLPMRKGSDSQFKEAHSLVPKSGDVKNASGMMRSNYKPPSPDRRQADSFLDGDDDDGDDGYGDGKGRSTRGLRVLSLKVKEIVGQKKRTSYKEVAETLTYELRQKSTTKSAKEESKDEQNVKRRVYDALNVLIAAGVLRKEGKLVYCEDSMAHIGSAGKKNSGNKDKILADIQEARKRNKAKIEMLHELVFKCLAIKNLVKTNKEKLEAGMDITKNRNQGGHVNAKRIEVVQENPALKPKNEDVIRFPFIVLLSSSPENSMNINMDTLQRQLAIESKKPFNIFGDIDVLLKMGLHYVTRKMFDDNIPLELQKYVPKYYLAALK